MTHGSGIDSRDDCDPVSTKVTAVTSALYLVATPIGNLGDITRRAIDVLSQVDIIAAEDTRHSQRLLSHLGIRTRLQACHEHNEDRISARLLDDIEAGKSIALISDAGTPLISDPGYRLVSQAHERGIRVVPIPGACAAISAISVSGLATDAFCFEGFPPAKHGARLNYLEQLVDNPNTMIFYISCHRVLDTLADMQTVFGADRYVCYTREITKTFETVKRGYLAEIVDWVSADPDQRKGEIVLVVEGAGVDGAEPKDIDHQLTVLMSELPVKQAVNLVVRMTGAHKNDVYKRALELNQRE